MSLNIIYPAIFYSNNTEKILPRAEKNMLHCDINCQVNNIILSVSI